MYIYSHDIIRSNGRRALHAGNNATGYVTRDEVENRQEVYPRTIQHTCTGKTIPPEGVSQPNSAYIVALSGRFYEIEYHTKGNRSNWGSVILPEGRVAARFAEELCPNGKRSFIAGVSGCSPVKQSIAAMAPELAYSTSQ